MKKSLIWIILGLTVGTISVANGQGGIVIGNYQAPYNPVVWPSASPGSGGVQQSRNKSDLVVRRGCFKCRPTTPDLAAELAHGC
jgi:hypothetical protein